MITSRYITKDDYPLLANSLASDEYHKDTTPDFFYEEGTVCSVFEDDNGPVLFAKATPIIQEGVVIIKQDIQYINNNDARRNMKTMLAGFHIIEQRARENGIAGFLFVSNAPLLRKFCVKRLGFYEINDEVLGKIIQPLDCTGRDEV